MKKFIFSMIIIFTNYSIAFAGTDQTTMECMSTSRHATISGSPQGEVFDLRIKIDNAVIRYTDSCDDIKCAKSENYGMLTVIDVLSHKVFTISFENSEGNNRGIFYALPDTVKYKQTDHGYIAQYKGIYLGDDPRSEEPYKAFVKGSGIEMTCTQQNKI